MSQKGLRVCSSTVLVGAKQRSRSGNEQGLRTEWEQKSILVEPHGGNSTDDGLVVKGRPGSFSPAPPLPRPVTWGKLLNLLHLFSHVQNPGDDNNPYLRGHCEDSVGWAVYIS